MNYRPEIDGLRALAVLPVILFHAGFELFSGGFVGVDVFFVISGYLITSIIVSEITEEKFSILNFYERRARRILPALFFVMAACIPFSLFWLGPQDLIGFGQSLVAVSTFTSNFFFWNESGYFATAAELKPLLHTWSLAVEEQYYIIFPIFMILAWKMNFRWLIAILVIVFILSLGLAEWAAFNKPNANFFLLPTRGWELLVGVFAALYLISNSYSYSNFLNQFLSILGMSMILYAIFFFDELTPFPSIYTLVPTIGTFFLIISATPKTIAHQLLSLSPLVGIGLISYSAYLWHQPILAFARHGLTIDLSNKILLLLSFASLVMGYISWRWIESPFRDKRKFKRAAIFKFSFIGMIAFIAFGLFFDKSNGMIDYYEDEDRKILQNFFNPSEYVQNKFSNILLQDFELSDKKKVLLIGDSNAEDLTNTIYESGAIHGISLSGYYIPAACGSLMIDLYKIKHFQPSSCQTEPNFDNDKLLELMQNADEVWISSVWKLWTLDFLDESIINLIAINRKVKIFGPKYLGEIAETDFMKFGKNIWKKNLPLVANTNFPIRRDRLNNQLRNLDVDFIDLQSELCNGLDLCPNYDGENIISFDGGHLTPYGAKKLGVILLKKGMF
jgi:peptidoglycan/LPS O-acetylase OafA/YrhL